MLQALLEVSQAAIMTECQVCVKPCKRQLRFIWQSISTTRAVEVGRRIERTKV